MKLAVAPTHLRSFAFAFAFYTQYATRTLLRQTDTASGLDKQGA